MENTLKALQEKIASLEQQIQQKGNGNAHNRSEVTCYLCYEKGHISRNSKKVEEVNPIQTEVMQIPVDIREEGMLVIKARIIVRLIRGLDQGLHIL